MPITSLNESIDYLEVPTLPIWPTSEDQLPELAVSEPEEQVAPTTDSQWDLLPISTPSVPALDYTVPKGFVVSVVVPVYNERATVLDVVARVKALPIETEIIIVDDCSTDGTRGWLETIRGAAGLQLIFKDRNEGKGAALRTGFQAATGDIVVIQDADLEYDPNDIVRVIRPLVTGQADVVFGSRFLNDTAEGSSQSHRMGNRFLTQLSNLFTGLQLTDMETCYKAFRRGVLRGIELRQDRFGFEPEITAKVARRNYRIQEVPISYAARSYAEGKKIGLRDAFNAVYCILRYARGD